MEFTQFQKKSIISLKFEGVNLKGRSALPFHLPHRNTRTLGARFALIVKRRNNKSLIFNYRINLSLTQQTAMKSWALRLPKLLNKKYENNFCGEITDTCIPRQSLSLPESHAGQDRIESRRWTWIRMLDRNLKCSNATPRNYRWYKFITFEDINLAI